MMATETRRQRQRRVLTAEILDEARAQLERGGPAAVSLRGIGRKVGMSAPSLYTYVPSVADLFTELLVQSYDALARDVQAALDDVVDGSIDERLRAGPRAYRRWALANRQQFNLIFFDQLTGYEAPADGPTVDAQTAVLRPMAAEYAAARGRTVDQLMDEADLLDDFLGWWGSFHGIVALEVNHHLDWVDADEVFERRLGHDVEDLTSPQH